MKDFEIMPYAKFIEEATCGILHEGNSVIVAIVNTVSASAVSIVAGIRVNDNGKHLDVNIGYDSKTRITTTDNEKNYFFAVREKIKEATEVGKFVIARAKDGFPSSRLFLYKGILEADICKDGWWDIFTISKDSKPFSIGAHLARIDSIRVDSNDNPILIVEDVMALDDHISLEDRAYKYILGDRMSNIYTSWKEIHSKFNLNEVTKQFGSIGKMYAKLLDGKLDFVALAEAMDTPTELDNLVTFILNREGPVKDHLLLYRKTEGMCRSELVEWLDNKLWDYDRLGMSSFDNRTKLDKVNDVLMYRYLISKEQKAKKTEQKKAKKASIKANPPAKEPKLKTNDQKDIKKAEKSKPKKAASKTSK